MRIVQARGSLQGMDVIAADDVVLHQHAIPRAADGGQLGIEVLLRVDQQIYLIAAQQGYTGCAAQCLFG